MDCATAVPSNRIVNSHNTATALIVLVLCLSQATGAPAAPASRPTAKSRQQYQSFALTHQGDPARGRKLFEDEQRLACTKCHATDSKGGKAGPDLSTIGDKFGRKELVESILFPSATIAVGYSTTIVKTRSGETYQGVIKEADGQSVGLIGADGKLVRIPESNIELRKTTDVSLMPEDLQAGLSQPEFADLIEYLSTLKLPRTAAAVHQGMPALIPELATPVGLVPVNSPENAFQHPVWFGPVPGLANTFTVVEHETGRIWLFHKDASGEGKKPFLDTGHVLTGTRGLLGMVFHPHYATNRRYFIVKHLVQNGKFASIVFEGEASADLKSDSGKPLRPVLKMDAVTNVHYGGCLQFGPDGMLYIGMGDSGPQGDPEGHAQNMGLLLGKMLRIDVDHPDEGKAYSIPRDNPFVGRAGARPEIWAYGLREPWRFSFDLLTGDLWVGDVGQDLFEEVDIVRKGQNYGWNVYEGFEPYSNKYRREGETYVPPVFAWTRKYGASSTGGFVYRADPKSSFYGVYIFGDYQNSRLFALTQHDRVLAKVRQIAMSPQHAVSFGRDEYGELYLVGYEGTIYKIDFSKTRFE